MINERFVAASTVTWSRIHGCCSKPRRVNLRWNCSTEAEQFFTVIRSNVKTKVKLRVHTESKCFFSCLQKLMCVIYQCLQSVLLVVVY